MRLVEIMCKELGVEVGEVWNSVDGNQYCILSDGLIEVNGDTRGYQYWGDIFKGLVRPMWEPEEGEIYYVPYINYNYRGVLYDRWEWSNTSKSSKWHSKLGLVFKTKEEAVKVANKMLEVVKKGE